MFKKAFAFVLLATALFATQVPVTNGINPIPDCFPCDDKR